MYSSDNMQFCLAQSYFCPVPSAAHILCGVSGGAVQQQIQKRDVTGPRWVLICLHLAVETNEGRPPCYQAPRSIDTGGRAPGERGYVPQILLCMY